jgi:DNA-binding beta-propeller fold protein YncE
MIRFVGGRNAFRGMLVISLLALWAPAAWASPSLYAGISGSPGGVAQYTLQAGGQLVAKRPPRVGPAIGEIGGVVPLPDGSSVYAANTFTGLGPVVTVDHRIWQYDVTPSGSLKLKQPRQATTGKGPGSVAVAPDGHSVYVADSHGNDISQFTVQPGSGKLVPKRPARVRSANDPVGILVSPNGKYLYVAGFLGNVLVTYSINPRTGALKVKGSIPVEQPVGTALTPDGRNLYVTVLDGIAQFTVNPATGRLTRKTQAVVPLAKAVALGVSPKGGAVYASVEGGVAQFSVNPQTGSLSAKNPAVVPVSGEQFPAVGQFVMNPAGTFLYATSDQPPNLFRFRVGPNGRLQPGTKVKAGGATAGIAVLPDAPRAAFSGRFSGGLAHFDARASTDPGASIARYAWSFGDGTHLTTNRPTVVHHYRRRGRYRVVLRLTSTAGCAPGRSIYTGRMTTCTGRNAQKAQQLRF